MKWADPPLNHLWNCLGHMGHFCWWMGLLLDMASRIVGVHGHVLEWCGPLVFFYHTVWSGLFLFVYLILISRFRFNCLFFLFCLVFYSWQFICYLLMLLLCPCLLMSHCYFIMFMSLIFVKCHIAIFHYIHVGNIC